MTVPPLALWLQAWPLAGRVTELGSVWPLAMGSVRAVTFPDGLSSRPAKRRWNAARRRGAIL